MRKGLPACEEGAARLGKSTYPLLLHMPETQRHASPESRTNYPIPKTLTPCFFFFFAFKVAYQFSYPNRLKAGTGGGVQEFRELEEEAGTSLRLHSKLPKEGASEDTT